MNKKKDKIRELAEEFVLIDNVLTCVDNGRERVMTHEEWERRIKIRLESKPLESIRDVENEG